MKFQCSVGDFFAAGTLPFDKGQKSILQKIAIVTTTMVMIIRGVDDAYETKRLRGASLLILPSAEI